MQTKQDKRGIWVKNGGVWGPDDPIPTPFNPLFIDDLSSYTIGQVYPGWHGNSTIINDAPGGGRALQMELNVNQTPDCGGSVTFGGRRNLAEDIPIGNTVWLSQKRYHPSTQTWAYCYATSDYDEAQACSPNTPADGGEWLKDLVLAPRDGFSRIYCQPRVQRRNIGQTAGNRIICEQGPLYNDNYSPIYPLDEWFTLQIMVKVSASGDGIIRVWINNNLINEVIGPNVSIGNVIREWGIGDWWNGIPYYDGFVNRNKFYAKEFIHACDLDGYGAPDGIDSNGNIFIDPNTTVEGLK